MLKTASPEAYDLIHRGTIGLSRVEHVGIRVDERQLQANINKTLKDMTDLELKMKADPLWRTWRKRFGDSTNLGSREQLGKLLFEDLGYETDKKTEIGRFKVDESVLQEVNHPFVNDYIWWQKLQKCESTFLRGIQREVCNGYLHPFFSLNIARTYRSSSDSPNFQNFPIRDKILGALIRSVFIPRKGRSFLEIDFKGVEVRVSACYNKDPVLIEYILDESKDMHRDMAAQCYKLAAEQVSKEIRYCGKNMFVFPQFYGDWYKECAKQMWEAVLKMHLVTTDGIPLGEWLEKKGIKERGACDPKQQPVKGTFEYHMKGVQDDFWGRRFQVYGKWKDTWFNQYTKKGYFKTYTGFVCSGVMARNDVINYPVQGAAFHLLLWSLIELQDWLIKNKMKSMIVGQIHDSLLLDVHPDELEVVYFKAREIMTESIKEFAPWLIVPLEIEVDASETNWHEKHSFAVAV
jgi:DNA polymerase-1